LAGLHPEHTGDMPGGLRRVRPLGIGRCDMWIGRCLLSTILATVLLICPACSSVPGERYVLPEGFRGCLEVEYGVPGAPRLTEIDGLYVIKVSRPNERIQTSSRGSGNGEQRRSFMNHTAKHGGAALELEAPPAAHSPDPSAAITEVASGAPGYNPPPAESQSNSPQMARTVVPMAQVESAVAAVKRRTSLTTVLRPTPTSISDFRQAQYHSGLSFGFSGNI